MIFFFAKKLSMDSLFSEAGNHIPVTKLQVYPTYLIKILSKELNGYDSLQIAGNPCSEKDLTKPLKKIFENLNLPYLKNIKEIKNLSNLSKYQVGDQFDLKDLEENSLINITGTSIGKGFTGNIKKNNFSRGPESHGSKHHRLQGSLGAGTTPGRVFPGKKMSGHLGVNKVTINNLQIIKIDLINSIIYIKGSVPGKLNSSIHLFK